MTISYLRRIIFLAGLALINSAAHSEELKIGVIANLSMPNSVGPMVALGVQEAVKDAIASGNFRDHRIVLFTEDDQCKPDLARAKAQKLIQIERIMLAIGHSCPSSSLVASDVYNAARVIHIDPVTTDPLLTERLRGHDSFLFRVSERQDRAAMIAVFVLRDALKNMKVRLVGDRLRQPWTDRFAKQLGAG
jgi:ABC-type branched-subunit amino acid transport system substrate-binding protein